jgi:hypothetical protein
MSRREHLFQIIVRCSDHVQVPRERILSRDTVEAAQDAARRELRRVRNTAHRGNDFDTWSLYDFDHGRRNRRLIAEETINGPSTPVPSPRDDRGHVDRPE